jgi:DNA repair protein RadD
MLSATTGALSTALSLRAYQLRALEGLRVEIRRGRKRIVLICPTGGGKTLIACAMILGAIARGLRVIFIAHRKELIDQTVEKLEHFGIRAGVIMGNDPRRDDYLPVQVCSIQTLARRAPQLPPGQLIIYDEVHHAAAASSMAVLEHYGEATVIGLTATPWRSDGFGLADWFQTSVVAATYRELFDAGYLVPYDPFAYDAPDLHDVGMVAGEFHQKQLDAACNTSVLVGSVVREYLTHARGRRGILFPVSTAHSRRLVDEFTSAGVLAAHVDYKTPKEQRSTTLRAFAEGAIDIVSSVGILTEGFDVPAAEVCILARPTQSLSLHLQMIGRVLRLSPQTGKRRALVHDHAGNLMRHGFPEDDRDYSLTATPKRTREVRSCPFCAAVFARGSRDGRCPNCRELVQPPAEQSVLDVVSTREDKRVVEGERLDRESIRAARNQNTPSEKKLAILKELVARGQAAGYKAGWAAKQYQLRFGVYPTFSMSEISEVA